MFTVKTDITGTRDIKGRCRDMFGLNRSPKTTVNFTEEEFNLVINSLVEWRNRLIQEGRYTDPIDELLLRIL